jgi:hypothetical protein
LSYLYAKPKLQQQQLIQNESPEERKKAKWKVVDSGENWNFWFVCNWCKVKKVCVNPNVINLRTGKKMLLEEEYNPNSGVREKIHWGCMQKKDGKKHNYVKGGTEIIYKCKYCKSEDKNHQCFNNSLVISESDNTIVKGIKMARQDKLTKWSRQQPRGECPKEWSSYSFIY